MNKLDYIYIFMQSNLIEVFVYFIFYRKVLSFGKTFGLVTFSNSITHPIVFFGFMAAGWSYLKATLFAEIFAIVGEALLHGYFGKLPYRRTWAASTLSNLLSWQLAPILTYFLFF